MTDSVRLRKATQPAEALRRSLDLQMVIVVSAVTIPGSRQMRHLILTTTNESLRVTINGTKIGAIMIISIIKTWQHYYEKAYTI